MISSRRRMHWIWSDASIHWLGFITHQWIEREAYDQDQ